MDKRVILSAQGITKTYPGVLALQNVSVDFIEGEIHALVGENGAGKSTLVKVLSGAIAPDNGRIDIDGKTFARMQPKEAKRLGIEIIYQEFNLVPSLSVAENIFLGNFEGNGVFIDLKAMQRKSRELFDLMQIQIDPSSLVQDLSVAEQQLVEIAKSLMRNARILIMDEPTAPLTVRETGILFNLIRNMKQRGVTIIYISHRFNEIFELSDRITVMRDGTKVTTIDTSDVDRDGLIRLMVGRSLSETYPRTRDGAGEVVFEVRNIKGTKSKDISFQLRRGEILGVAGLVGAGRTELMRCIFGADPIESGDILVKGKKVHIKSPGQAVAAGIAYVPEDRKQHGVLIDLSVRENITLPILKNLSRCLFLKKGEERSVLNQYKDSLKIKTPSFDQKVKNLSGGNQQKVVLSKWLASGADILIFDEPTRGIDVGAKHEIYQLMDRLVQEGKSIIMVSSEMEELLGMSDRIVVLHEGSLAGSIENRDEFSQEKIMAYASGK